MFTKDTKVFKGVIRFGEYKTAYENGHVGFYINFHPEHLAPQLAIHSDRGSKSIEVIGNIYDDPKLMNEI